MKLNIPERTLRHQFQNKYSVSPKRFIHSLRLNQVRKSLRNNKSTSSKIKDYASDYNFWHMGQFGKDYIKLFGELPSETLRTVIASDKLAGVDLLY